MPSILQRHPRYAIFSGFLLLSTFLLLASQRSPSPTHFYDVEVYDDPLETRLTLAERIYQKTVKERGNLIRKFGPTPERIELYVFSSYFIFPFVVPF